MFVSLLTEMDVTGSIVIMICVLAIDNVASSSPCPLWYSYNESTGSCECVSRLSGGIVCKEPGQVYLRIDLCMTLDRHSNVTIAGTCHRGYYNYHQMISTAFGLLPNDSSQLEEMQCKPNKRQGLLCGECVDGYGVSVTSLTPKCTECKYSTLAAVLLYLVIELLPITAFFIVIVIFHINIMVGPLMGYFIFCQAYTAATNQYFELYLSLLSHAGPFTTSLLYISHTLSSLWALCSFNILPPVCISPKISLMDAIAMKYVRVVYPLLLVPVTYILIELHTRNFKPVVCIWKPFKMCLTKVNQNISNSDSIIHAYATLYLLSFAVLNYVSFMLLNRTNLVAEGEGVRKNRLISDPTVRSYSSEHAPYVAIAFVALLFLGIIPAIILCLYPIGLFRNTLERIISQRKRIILNTFAETLHSNFNNGLNGTRDYRPSLGIVMLATMILIIINVHQTGYYTLSAILISGCVLMLAAIVVAYIQPCSTFLGNLSFTFHTALSSILCFQIMVWTQPIVLIDIKTMVNLFAVLNILPHVLIAMWLGYKASSKLMHHTMARWWRTIRLRGYATLS